MPQVTQWQKIPSQPRARSNPVLAHLPMARKPLTEQSRRPQGRQLWEAGPGFHRPTGGSSISPCRSALPPASPSPELSRLSAAQRTTAGRSWRGKRAVLGGLGLCQEANGTQLGRPARLEEEGGREGSAAAEALDAELHCRAPGLALRRGTPVPLHQPGEPAGEQSKAGPCVPRAALEGAPAAGWREGGQARRSHEPGLGFKGPPLCPPFLFLGWDLRKLERARDPPP